MRSVGAQLSPCGSEGYSTLTVLSHASGITRKDFSVLSAALSAHLLGRKNLKYPFLCHYLCAESDIIDEAKLQ